MTQPTSDWLRPLGSDQCRHLDVAPLVSLVGDAKVAALGEGAHNIEEFLLLRNDLLRALVTELGFTAVVVESGFAEGVAVDAYVQGGAGDATRIAREAISYRFGECAPAVAQLNWMRRHNTSGAGSSGRVHWYGMDLPGDSTSPEAALRVCLSRIPSATGDDELLQLANLGRGARAAASWAALPAAARERLYDGIEDVVRRTSDEGDAIARRCADALVAFVAESRWQPERAGDEPYPRDAFMADTVGWVTRRHERVLVCAHNGHVQRSPLDGRPTLGHLLAARLGEQLLVIGQTYGAGPEVRLRERSSRPFDWDVELHERELAPGSFESAIERELEGGDDVPAYLVRPRAMDAGLSPDLAHAFDAVVHHRRVRQVPGAFERLREGLEDR